MMTRPSLRRTLLLSLVPLLLGGATVAAGCGGDGTFAQGFLRIIQVEADGESVDYDEGLSIDFVFAQQSSVTKEVRISNIGDAPMTLSEVGWLAGGAENAPVDCSSGEPYTNSAVAPACVPGCDDLTELTERAVCIDGEWFCAGGGVTTFTCVGTLLKNPYMEIDFRGLLTPNDFPHTIEANGEMAFDVIFTPPFGTTLDDFRDSVLVIASDAKRDNGVTEQPLMYINFAVPQKSSDPKVTPANYQFQNATPTKPETQTFTLYNDCELGTAPYTVTNLRFESATNEFKFINEPSLPHEVPVGNPDPSVCNSLPAADVLQFAVIYQPVGSGESDNAVLVTIEGASGDVRVPLTSGSISGSWELSFEYAEEFDFRNETVQATRSVLLRSAGPGPIQVKEPEIVVPDEAGEDTNTFSYECFKPPVTADTTAELITSWPRGLSKDATLRCDVTYTPPVDGSEPPNAELLIPIETPDAEEIRIGLFAGTAKPKLVLGPPTGNISVTADTSLATTGSRKLVIYNEGNGDLSITNVETVGPFGPATLFSVPDSSSVATPVPPNGVRIVDIAWDTASLADPTGATETLKVTYFNPYIGGDVEESFGLFLAESGGMDLPTAEISASTETPTVGETVYLNGFELSDPGSLEFTEQSYIWYLTSKPADSQARFNIQGGSVQGFTADVPGAYTFELVLLATEGSDFLLSEPADLTLSFAASE